MGCSVDCDGGGINIGNALDAPVEGQWGVTIKEEFFDVIKAAGVTTLSWTVSGTDHVTIKWQAKNGQDAVSTRLPVSGSLPVSLP